MVFVTSQQCLLDMALHAPFPCPAPSQLCFILFKLFACHWLMLTGLCPSLLIFPLYSVATHYLKNPIEAMEPVSPKPQATQVPPAQEPPASTSMITSTPPIKETVILKNLHKLFTFRLWPIVLILVIVFSPLFGWTGSTSASYSWAISSSKWSRQPLWVLCYKDSEKNCRIHFPVKIHVR